jgi:phospholipase D1/2
MRQSGSKTWRWCWVTVEFGTMYWIAAAAGDSNAESISLLHAVITPTVKPSKLRALKLRISTPFHTACVALTSEAEMDSWLALIKANTLTPNEFGSQVPWHTGINGKWFIDGQDTFYAMHEAISAAEHSIYMTDWFLTPELWMVRHTLATDDDNNNNNGGSSCGSDKRLDALLVRKAQQGVQIFVLPWAETKVAMDLNSHNTKQVLERLHPNIRVICHPLTWPMKWSHHQKTLVIDHTVAFIGGLDLCLGRFDLSTHPCTDLGMVPLFPGKDYYNPAIHEMSGVDDLFSNAIARDAVPRMPWHDVHMMVDGQLANDIALNFIQRWNHHRAEVAPAYPILRPRRLLKRATGSLRCVLLRSCCSWSVGTKTEMSIYQAYIDVIARAQRFIYIENQYFISNADGGASDVQNRIAQTLADKVCACFRDNRPFRVIVVLPIHPEGSPDAATTRAIMHYQYSTIFRGEHALLPTIIRQCPEIQSQIDDWVSFYALRSVGRLRESLACEQIYVHTKLMIVDDRYVILGSANINDRSMMGNRDSEIAVLLEDMDVLAIASSNNNASNISDPTGTTATPTAPPIYVGRFAHELRLSLWLEHLGLDSSASIALVDPLADSTFHGNWRRVAASNTAIIHSVFGNQRTIPFSPEAATALESIMGHLVVLDDSLVSESECSAALTDVSVRLAGAEVFV